MNMGELEVFTEVRQAQQIPVCTQAGVTEAIKDTLVETFRLTLSSWLSDHLQESLYPLYIEKV